MDGPAGGDPEFDWIMPQDEWESLALNYTSGTTGLPKGSMITQKNMVSVARLQDAVDAARADFEYVSFLPFAWIGEQEFGVYWPLYKAFAVNFPEKVETVQENIREIGPHILLAPPRIWEKICSDIQVKIQEAVWIKRFIYRKFLPVGYRMADFILANRNSPNQGVLSGSTVAIAKAADICRQKGYKSMSLPVSAAFHSRWVNQAQKPFRAAALSPP